MSDSTTFSLENCLSTFSPTRVESTAAGYQFWFVDRHFLDGRTIKMSVVAPHRATHPPHAHPEDEFFFVLEGSAECYLNGKTKVVGPLTSFYAPSQSLHGIRNVGETPLKYLVIKKYPVSPDTIAVAGFANSAHHWYDIKDDTHIFEPVPGQRHYRPDQVREIADNILLYQRPNGGWPKNHDMLAILTPDQLHALAKNADTTITSFDNGTTHPQVEYLAQAYTRTGDQRYRRACERGITFLLRAQYPNGGWPQFFPDTTGYRRYITFNDGAMTGVVRVLHDIARRAPQYVFLDEHVRENAQKAFDKGLACILRSQVKVKGTKTVWCQQHDNVTLEPRGARTYEPPALTSLESADLVLLLMSLDHPAVAVREAIEAAVAWFREAALHGIKVETTRAPVATYQYRTVHFDRVVIEDSLAPRLWARYYSLENGAPLFSNRDGKTVSTLAEVERERRTGYSWYCSDPERVLAEYPLWRAKAPMSDGDKIRARYPGATPAFVSNSTKVVSTKGIVYTSRGDRKLCLDLFSPQRINDEIHPAVVIVHGGGWRAGTRDQEWPLAEFLAAHGYVAATVDYRLSGEAIFPAALHDIKEAVRWFRANAAPLHVDPSQIAALGCSAGGTLAALLGTTGDVKRFVEPGTRTSLSDAVQAVVDIDGVLDLTDPAESGHDSDPASPSAAAAWLGGPLRKVPEVWRDASPLYHVSGSTPPFLFVNSAQARFHAGRDSLVSLLSTFGTTVEVHTLPDTPHSFWLYHPWFEETASVVTQFLDRILEKPASPMKED